MTRITDPDFRLRDHYTPPTVPALPKTGLILDELHKPALKLSDYIHAELASPPAAVSRPHPGFAWGMLANDKLGDCVIAMMLHSIEDFHLDAGTPVPAFTDEDAISMYSAITGYNPNDPSSDRGTNERMAMRYWEHPGLKTSDGETHKIVATVAVDAEQPQRVPDRDRRVRRPADRDRAAGHRAGSAGVDGRRRRQDRQLGSGVMGRPRHPLPGVRRRDLQVRHLGRGASAHGPVPPGLRAGGTRHRHPGDAEQAGDRTLGRGLGRARRGHQGAQQLPRCGGAGGSSSDVARVSEANALA